MGMCEGIEGVESQWEVRLENSYLLASAIPDQYMRHHAQIFPLKIEVIEKEGGKEIRG